MKLLRIFFHALGFFLLALDPAFAGPVIAAVGAFFTAVASTALGQIIIGVALSVASTLIQRAMAGTPEEPPVPGVSAQILVGGDNPTSFIVGRYSTMGQREYINTFGEDDNVPNVYLLDLISLGDLPYTELESVIVDGDSYAIRWDLIDSDGWSPVQGFIDDGDYNLYVKFYDGTQTAADASMIEIFGTNPDRPWSADMIGRGVPYAMVRAKLEQEVFSGVPRVKWVCKGIKLYDVRKDSTAGGSGTHRWGDQATYEFSDNPFVIAYNIIRGIYYGTQWVYGLQNISALRLPAGAWMAAMNEADRLIPKAGGGTEKQFRVGAEIMCDVEPIRVIEELMKSCSGRIAENGGVYKPLCGVPGGSVYSFTDEDIVVTEPQSFDPAPGLEDTENGMHGSYPEPAEAWETKDAPPYYRLDYEQDDDDRRLLAKAEFPYVPYPIQVQRLMRTMVDENRRFRKHQFVMPPETWLFEPNDVVTYTSTRNGYVNKKFLITAMGDEDTVFQTMQLQELDPTDYDWSTTFEAPWFTAVTTPVRYGPQIMFGWTATASSVPDETGTARRPAILVGWDIAQDNTAGVDIEIRVKLTGAVVYNGSTRNFLAGSALIANQAILPLTQYEVRGRYIPKTNRRRADWSAWLTVTTLDLRITADDILAGAIREIHLADRAVTNLKIALLALDETLIQNDAIITRTIADLAINEAKVAANAISVTKIVDGAIANGKLADDAVTQAKIANAAIGAAELMDGSVTGPKIAAAAVGIANFAAGIAPVEIGATLPTVGNFEGRQFFNTADGLLYSYHSGVWAALEATVGPGSITETEIAPGAITTPKLAANAVTADKIAANAVTATAILAGSITAGKIAAGAVSATEIAAGAIIASKLAIGDTSNMLPDATLLDPASWSLVGPNIPTFNTTTSAGYTGGKYIRIAHSETIGGSTLGYAQTDYFPVEQGKQYSFGADVVAAGQPATGAMTASVRAYWYNGSNKVANATEFSVVGSIQMNGNAEGEISGIVTAPTGAAWCRVMYLSLAPSAGAVDADGYNYFRNMWGRRAASGQLIVDGAITALKIAAGTITGDRMVANAITARELTLTNFTNLIPNSNFETGDLSSWHPLSNVTQVIHVANVSYPGGHACRLQAANVNTAIMSHGAHTDLTSGIPVIPGEEYRIGATFFNSSTTNVANMYAYFRKIDGTFTSISMAIPQLSSWVQRAMEFTVPADCNNMRMYVLLHDVLLPTVPVGHLYFGNAFITRRMDANLIVDGAITATKIAANSVTSASIVAGTIVASDIASNTITATQIAASAITASEIAASTITGAKIAADTITSANILAGTITATEIGTGAVTAVKIATGAITAIKLTTATAVITESLQIGTTIIDTEHLLSNAITAVGSAFSAADIEVLEASYVTLQSVAITPNAGRVMLVGMFHVDVGSGVGVTAPVQFTIQFKRGATVINTTNGFIPVKQIISGNPGFGGNVAFSFVDNTPGTAAVTYAFTAQCSPNTNFMADDRFLSALNCKK